MALTENKLAKDLQPGDRVLMEDGKVRTVKRISKGFVTYRPKRGEKGEKGIMIDWADGDFSQVPRSFDATIAEPARVKKEA